MKRNLGEDLEGRKAWLRYAALPTGSQEEQDLRKSWRGLCHSIILIQAASGKTAMDSLSSSPVMASTPSSLAQDPCLDRSLAELKTGLLGLLGLRPRLSSYLAPNSSDAESTRTGTPQPHCRWNSTDETYGFILPQGNSDNGTGALILWAKSARSLLYGAFKLLTSIGAGLRPESLPLRTQAHNALRMLDHWDNMDGSIERGYAGKSLFFAKGRVLTSASALKRIDAYARLLASVGINAVAINNVNVHEVETQLITSTFLPDLARLARVFRQWGIRLFLSVNYAAPITLGDLTSADPLDHRVEDFWAGRAREIWSAIPDFGGFVVKADSEGRPGPFTYGRSHAEGANMLARALAPFGGIVLWRCFVYNCRQDWRDRRTDRARAAYDHFMALDGNFADNVALQIKNGPMDFQVREPVSPLLGAMKSTNQVVELQITQEYTGQQRHLCCLVPQWKEVLDFVPDNDGYTIGTVVAGQTKNRALGGMVAVANVGDDPNWTGHHLAQVNLFAYGRLAWNPFETTDDLIGQWIRLSFGFSTEVCDTLELMLKNSWAVYESYTAPLGVGWMVNPDHHYGPNVNGYEYSRWGTYHFADRNGIGVDRTIASGTGYTAQYKLPWSGCYENLATCPDELILFFHHVPWNHRLQNGKTVIQHIYDTHFSGLEQSRAFLTAWRNLKALIDSPRHQEVLARLQEQASLAREWCDQINTYCYRMSGIPDAHGRQIY